MYITLNSKFKPFTYDELVKPLQDYGEAYREVEKEYTDLASQTSAWENIIPNESTSKSYKLYSDFSESLNKIVDAFTTKGMTAENRGALLKLKAGYEKSIGAIDKAYTAMKEHNALVDAAGPDAVFVKGRSNNIDDFLYGQHIDNTYISKKDLETSVIGDVLASANTKYAELISAGYKPDVAISKIASGEFIGDNELITNVQSKIGGYNTFDDAGKKQIDEVINSGVTKGLGSFVDKQMMDAAQRDTSARGWANLEESKKQHENAMISNGYKKDTKGNWVIDETSPKWVTSGVYFENGIPKVGTKPSTGGGEPKGKVEKLNTNLVIVTKDDGSVELQDKSSKVVYSGYKKYKEHSPEIQEKIRTAHPGKSPSELEEYLFGIGDDGSIALQEIKSETRTINAHKGVDNLLIE